MGFFAFFSTTIACFLGAFLVFAIPWFALYSREKRIPRPFLFFGVIGAYATLIYIKPNAIALWVVPLVILSLSIIQIATSKTIAWREAVAPLRQLPVIGIITYSFLMFFLRWDPPGTDAIKWGSLTRLLLEHGAVPGNCFPLAPIPFLKGANLGYPIAISMIELGDLIPIERVVNFVSCCLPALFTFSLIHTLKHWFDEKASLWAGLLSLTFFTAVQGYLGWGGTPTLGGLVTGFVLIDIAMKREGLKAIPLFLYALVLVGTAHFHPIGFYVSTLVLSPILIWRILRQPSVVLVNLLLVGVIFAVGFSPFLRYFGMDISPHEMDEAWKWQKEMSPYLFREGHSLFYNLYSQVGAYHWSTAFLGGFLLFLAVVWGDRRRREFFFLGLAVTAVALGLVANVKGWWLPFSYLLYPERIATLLVVPMAGGIAFAVECAGRAKLPSRKIAWGFLFAVLAVLSVRQFQKRLWPFIQGGVMTPEDRAALVQIPMIVPPGECVRMKTLDFAGRWVPPISFRCTDPYHLLGMNVFDEEEPLGRTRWRWYFQSAAEVKTNPPPPGTVVIDTGARLYRE